jgi:hypothetical protein
MTNRNRIRLSKLSLCLIAALAAAPVFAQSTSAGVSGSVTDAAGKPVVGADVTITHIESGSVSRATTDGSGRYNARGLRVGGPYTITITKAGSGTDTEDNVFLGLDRVAEVDAQLKNDVSTLATVSVVGSRIAETFEPNNKGLTTTLNLRDLKNAPMPNRSIQDVARLDPRVVITDQSRGEISALGQNSRYNNISVDAVGVNDPFGLEANGLPYAGTPISIDTIQEYSISTANFDVSTNRAVGVNINAVTKSGTNDFHGSVYYSYTDADNLTSKEPATFTGFQRKWDAGVTLGGPILKDRLFFFAAYEKSLTVAPGPTFGPVGSGASTEIANLTQADIDQIISIAEGYGMRPGSLAASNVNIDSKRSLVKLDWNINDSHRASFRYNKVDEVEPVINGFSTSGVGLSSYWYARHRTNDNYVLNLYDDWSENFSTEASLSYTDYFVARNGLNGDQPQVVIYLGGGSGRGNSPYVDLGEEQYSHYNELGVKTWRGFFAGTWYVGDHNVKFGFDYSSDKIYNLFGRTQFGAYTFNGIANFAAGNYYQFDLYQPAPGYTINDVAAQWTLNQWGFFAQDTWQVNDRLSLQYGLRYDLPKTSDVPIYNAAFESAFGFSNTNTIDGNGLLQPRLSFNYQFDQEHLAQLRGGVGLFQGQALGVWLTNPYQNNGLTVATYSIRNSANDPLVSGQFPFSGDPYNQNVPPPSSSQMQVDTLAPGFRQPSVWKATLGFDKELPFGGIIASVEWEGLRVKDGIFYRNLNIGAPTGVLPDGRLSFYCNPTGGTGGNTSRCNANPAFAQAVTVLDNTNKGKANYVTFSLKRPFQDNWSWSVAFTTGNATEVNPGTSSQASSNFSNSAWVNPNEDIASTSNYAINNRLNASFSWQHKFFGDYNTTVSAFYDGHTGQVYSWVFGNDANGDSYSTDLVYIPKQGDVSFTGSTTQQVIDEFYAYIAQDPYLRAHQGSIAGRNGDHSPWVNRFDLSLRQELPGFMKGHKAELRFDIYNFLNLLNKKWGQEERIFFPYGRTLASYSGVDANGKYIYSLPTSGGHYAPEQLGVYDTNAISRWQVRVTLRYEF